MTAQTIILSKDRAQLSAQRAASAIQCLPANIAWRIEITEHKRRRSDDQNRYLWSGVYGAILKGDSESLRGWTADDLHDFFLGSHFGWEEIEGFGKKRIKPLRRSSKLTTVEFAGFIAFIQQFMAERGFYIADPGEL